MPQIKRNVLSAPFSPIRPAVYLVHGSNMENSGNREQAQPAAPSQTQLRTTQANIGIRRAPAPSLQPADAPGSSSPGDGPLDPFAARFPDGDSVMFHSTLRAPSDDPTAKESPVTSVTSAGSEAETTSRKRQRQNSSDDNENPSHGGGPSTYASWSG